MKAEQGKKYGGSLGKKGSGREDDDDDYILSFKIFIIIVFKNKSGKNIHDPRRGWT